MVFVPDCSAISPALENFGQHIFDVKSCLSRGHSNCQSQERDALALGSRVYAYASSVKPNFQNQARICFRNLKVAQNLVAN
jgi:hypothetical protein